MQLPQKLKSVLILPLICIHIIDPLTVASGQTNLFAHIEKLIDSGHSKEAIPLLDSVLRADPNNEGALYTRATALEQTEQTQKALTDLNHLIELNKHTSKVFRLRSHVLVELGRTDDAVKDMNASLASSTSSREKFWAYYERGKLFRLKGKNEDAVQDFSKAIAEKAFNSAYMQRGSAEADLHHYAAAIKDFTTAIAVSTPNEINMHSYYSLRASAYRKSGDLKRAAADEAKAKKNIDNQFGKFFDRTQ